jgi:uncharacterized membrane protein YdjX (TVP38/TMEM64 family)
MFSCLPRRAKTNHFVPYPWRVATARLLILLAAVAAAFTAAALFLPHSPDGLRALVPAVGIAGPAIVLLAWVALTPALVSGTVLAAAGGLAFGAPGGAALSLAGAVLGGLAAFLLARTLARGRVETMVAGSERLTRLNGLLGRRGFQTILAARLMPGVPATGLHYAAGVSPVSTPAFTGAMAIGAALRTTPYALLGSGVAGGSLPMVVVAVGSVFLGGLGAAAIVRHARRSETVPAA